MSSPPTLYCTFRVGGRLYGVSILDVREVTTETTCTRIPQAPDEVAGYVSIRGQIHLVLDLRRMLGEPVVQDPAARRLLLFKPTVGPVFGVFVDAIGDIVAVTADQVEEYCEGTSGVTVDHGADLVVRLCKLPEELLAVLEPRRFLPWIESLLAAT